MKDITTREDIEILVQKFYQKLTKDDVIGFFFTDIAKIELHKHLPKMYDFWESILLGNPVYDGSPMAKHFPLNDVVAMEEKHFKRWLQVWEETIRENYAGKNAETAVTRALNIARIMHHKMVNARR
ncbi:group III truncated hemoglobin [Epilithonimonas tenax]|uniref:group III truncated hemoglobin n=1 Tax=Epilithonimonas tenax TaxID=191577 RepID=UPI0004135FD0|nr:group III truncated hemoglobin [Epilithonimonas tenax]